MSKTSRTIFRISALFSSIGSVALLLTISVAPAFADSLPDCLDQFGRPISVNNDAVLHWKSSTRNKFVARAHIEGVVVTNDRVKNRNGHDHFAIEITGNTGQGEIEVVYNDDFGPLPKIHEGMVVEACGDYITATGPSGSYPPSPVGAIIHWVHKNERPDGHPSGFLAIEHELFGYGQDRNPHTGFHYGSYNPSNFYSTSKNQ